MLDIATLIRDTLEAEWSEVNPALADFIWSMDEMDPRWAIQQPSISTIILQVLFENFPERKTFIAKVSNGIMYKTTHACRITIYLRPVKYDETSIESAKTVFKNVKSEIDRILSKKKFTISGVSNIELGTSGWNDKMTVARGRGIKVKTEPIIFTSEMTVYGVYYIVG